MFNPRPSQEQKLQNYSPQYYSSQSLTPIPKIYSKEYRSPQNNQYQQRQFGKIQQNKSFLDGFDNNNSSYLNENKSYARNIRGRLMNNEDPAVEKVKEDRVKSYREQLARQMEEDRIRKEKKRKEQQEIEVKRQKLFYEKVKIEAQQKMPSEKDGNAYFLMRTNYKKKLEAEDNKKVDNFVQAQIKRETQREGKPKLSRRAYQNHRYSVNQQKSEQTELLARERSYQEQRISKIMLFQQNMMKKLQFMKTEIRNTSSRLQVDKEVERIRFKLKANQVSVDRGNQSDRVAEINSSVNNFYSLPKRKVIKPPSSKYEFRLNDIKRKEMNRTPKKPTVYNDKNFLNIEEEENPEDEEEEEMLN